MLIFFIVNSDVGVLHDSDVTLIKMARNES